MSVLNRLVQPFTDLVRWGEPWDVEDDDPLLETATSRGDDALNAWS